MATPPAPDLVSLSHLKPKEHIDEDHDDDDRQEHYHDNHDVQWSCLQSIVRPSEADR